MELLQSKLKKTSRAYSAALLIFALFNLYFAANYLVAVLLLLTGGGETLIGKISGVWSGGMPTGWWTAYFLLALLSAAAGAWAYFTGSAAFRGIARSAEPFSLPAVKKLKTMVWLLAANIPLTAGCGYMAVSFGPGLMGSSRMAAVTAVAGGVLDVVLFFALVSVFQYGAQLQQLSDETL